LHESLVWVKDSMVLGHSDYHYQHEPILYGWKGKNRHWYAGRDQVSIFEIPRPKRSTEHPTMKPVELVEAHLVNSTRKNDRVYDPFLGSGTTLVACERLGRQGCGVELDPIYFAVVLQRLAEMGLDPEVIP
jgi:DNA modification methylase